MGFYPLVRDQEVDGSNPFAPTISFRTSHLQHTKSRRAPGAKPGGQSSNFIEPTALILAGVEG